MTDIVERLRGWSGQGSPVNSTDIYAMTQEAAAEIERLRGHKEEADRHIRTIAELRHEIERLQSCLYAQESVPALYKEIERLRALLIRYQVANYIPEDCDLYAETRRALEPKP